MNETNTNFKDSAIYLSAPRSRRRAPHTHCEIFHSCTLTLGCCTKKGEIQIYFRASCSHDTCSVTQQPSLRACRAWESWGDGNITPNYSTYVYTNNIAVPPSHHYGQSVMSVLCFQRCNFFYKSRQGCARFGPTGARPCLGVGHASRECLQVGGLAGPAAGPACAACAAGAVGCLHCLAESEPGGRGPARAVRRGGWASTVFSRPVQRNKGLRSPSCRTRCCSWSGTVTGEGPEGGDGGGRGTGRAVWWLGFVDRTHPDTR